MAEDTLLHRWFLKHPTSVGESYFEHMGVATRFGWKMIAGGIGCLLHGFFPALCVRTGSGTVKTLYGEMKSRQPAYAQRRTAFQEPEWQLEYEI